MQVLHLHPQDPCPGFFAPRLPPMAVFRLLLLIVALWPLAWGMQQTPGPAEQGDEDPQQYLKSIQREAAEYRLERSYSEADPDAEEAARRGVGLAQASFDDHRWRSAANIAHSTFRRQRYTATTQTLGDLKRIEILAQAQRKRISDVRQELARLWFYFPDYNNLSEVMDVALVLAEETQDFTTQIDLDADQPQQVVHIDGTGYTGEITNMFRFLSTYGDRVTTGARADLGLARAELLGGNPKDLSPARFAYNDFIQRHPRHPLVFEALCELALSHLVTYRGKLYDIGALVSAAQIVEQAELVAGSDPQKAALVAKYRSRIRSWQQDRDLSVARWYRDRTRPAWLAWLKEPSGYNWDNPARFYYQEVIKRDGASNQARIAARELATLPPSERDPFRADLLPNRQ